MMLEDFDEEPVGVHDIRPTIEVTPTYHLCWKDISLHCFLSDFLSHEAIDVRRLTHIDLSHNSLTSLPTKIFRLPHLESLNVSHNKLKDLSCLEAWHPASKLQVLKASHNEITISSQCPLLRSDSNTTNPFNEFWYLDLSHNELTAFPLFVFQLRQIHYVDISHNTQVCASPWISYLDYYLTLTISQITKLPTQLGRLKKLATLVLQGLNLFHPPQFIVEQGTAAIIDHMRGKLKQSSPWSSMRVVVVGSRGSGKTSLIRRLKGETSSIFTVTRALDVSLAGSVR